jgi:hypothetical protein
MKRSKKDFRSAFTLVEATMSVLIVSILLVAAISAGDVAAMTQYRTGDRAVGRLLADGLMTDILSLAYQDPTYPTLVCGPEANESRTNKTTYDDVDDYNGWTESPPQDRNGNVVPGFTNWTRSVTVQWCPSGNPQQVSSSETGCKLVTVHVYHKSVLVATRTALKVKAP